MSEQTVRGYMLFSTLKYLETNYDEATRAAICEAMSPRVRDVIAKIDNVAWYPKEDMSEMFKAIALHHHGTDGKVREALEGVGKAIGETATNTFLKLIMKLLTPSLFKSKLPDFWRRDHKFGVIGATVFDTNERRFVVSLSDVAGYDYIGPVGVGFLQFALEGVFNHKNIRSKYDWNIETPGPTRIDYELTWG